MEEKQENFYPIIFLGISEHFKSYGLFPPVTPVDISGLSKQSTHIIYPIPLKSVKWVFLINTKFILKNIGKAIKIEVRSQENEMKVSFKMQVEKNQGKEEPKLAETVTDKGSIVLPKEPEWYIQSFSINTDASLNLPDVYNIYAGVEKVDNLIDQIHFLYQKVPPFTADQIKAIESSPFTSKKAFVEIGCTHCPAKLKAYTSLNQDAKKEKEGFVWQHNLPDEFICSCQKSKQKLTYLKESMHGLLGRYKCLFDEKISYERRHSHREILKILENFNNLLQKKDEEKFFQGFIEDNPIMLAKYHAKKIFFKKDLLGKFEADIVIINTENQVIFIELEPAGLPLFKRNGHPTAKLMHAYGQVIDWMNEYKKNPHALLEILGLKFDDISSIKGVVIAGRNRDIEPKHLRRHYANKMYPDIEFLTYDCLADSLAQISRDLI